jgi:hypothetical protein
MKPPRPGSIGAAGSLHYGSTIGPMREFYRRHWIPISVGNVAALTALAIGLGVSDAPTWTTVFFAAVAGTLLLAVLFRSVMTAQGTY